MSDNNDDPERSLGQLENTPAVSSDSIDEMAKRLQDAITGGKDKKVDEELAKDLISKNPELLKKKFDWVPEKINAEDNPTLEEATPLMLAAAYGRTEVFKCIHEMSTEDDPSLDERLAALILATRGSHISIAQSILNASPIILNRRDKAGDTCLLKAARSGNINSVKWLLDNKADVLAQDEDGNTALHFVCQSGTEHEATTNVMQGYHQVIKSILNSRPGLLEKRNNCEETPLLVAARYGRPSICILLMNQMGADTSAQDDSGNTALHLISKLSPKDFSSTTLQGELLVVVKTLLKQTPSLLEKRNDVEETALLRASLHGNLYIVLYLCKLGADKETRDRWGYTPLLNSAYFDAGPVLKYLIDSKADTMAKNASGSNALHLACVEGYSSIVGILLTIPQHQLKKLMVKSDHYRRTPLRIAVERGDVSIVSQLLQSRFYFPQNPALDEVNRSPDSETQDISNWLLAKLRQSDSENKQSDYEESDNEENENKDSENEDLFSDRSISAVFCWALLNTNSDEEDENDDRHGCDDDLVTLVHMNHHPKLSSQADATWLHMVALVGNIKLLQFIPGWRDDIVAEARKKTTPLHIAARMGHLKFLGKLLASHKRKYGLQEVLNAILQETEDLDTLISLAASQGRLKVEEWLWDMIFDITKGDRSFSSDSLSIRSAFLTGSSQMAPNSEFIRQENNRQHVIGVATWRYTAGERRYLHGLRNLIEGRELNKALPNDSSSVLEFLVERKFPIALWWLLSGGDYFDETHLKECEKVFEMQKPLQSQAQSNFSQHNSPQVFNAAQLVMDLLQNLPRQRIPKEEQGLPQFQHEAPCKGTLKGTVLDVEIKEDSPVVIKLKRADIVQIVYCQGPEDLMSNNNSQNLQSIKERLFSSNSTGEFSVQQTGDVSAPTQGADHLDQDKKKNSAESSGFKHKLRWIHIPKNDLNYVKDLMTRISREKSINKSQHRRLLALTDKSYLEIPSGEGTSYMRPHCQFDDSESIHMLSLFVPYIFWGNKRAAKKVKELEREGISQNSPVLDTQTPAVPDQTHNIGGQARFADTQRSESTGTIQALQETQIPSLNRVLENYGTSEQQQSRWPADDRSSGKGIDHRPLTLDQYYYESLRDTYDRDDDQVLSRLFKNAAEKEKQRAKDAEKQKDTIRTNKKEDSPSVNPQDSYKTAARTVKPAQILMVNQLWLWILDNHTIITSTTEEDKDIQKTFLQRVLDNLHRTELDNIQQNDKRASPINHIAALIMDTARSLFNARDIEIYDSDDGKIAPLDAYRQAIQDMRELETSLFKIFRTSLDDKREKLFKKRTWISQWASALKNHLLEFTKSTKEDSASKKAQLSQQLISHTTALETGSISNPRRRGSGVNQERPSNSPRSRDKDHLEHPAEDEENPYQDISQETGLLEEIKDILDELNILRTLAQEQDHVDDMWKQIQTKQKSNHAVTPSEISREIESMIGDAKSVQGDINTLLDLKQKEASIIEAKATREQSDTVMTFTVVTIIFLPASFLTSLFALNISDFPHQNGNVEYKGWWIFPIIFGVSFIVSGFFVVLAFNTNGLKKFFQGHSNEKDKDDEANKPNEKRSFFQRALGKLHTRERHAESRTGPERC